MISIIIKVEVGVISRSRRSFVISRIIKVEVGVISRSGRLRLITVTETSIILDTITKTESNNCFIIHSTKKKGPCLQQFFQCLARSTKQT